MVEERREIKNQKTINNLLVITILSIISIPDDTRQSIVKYNYHEKKTFLLYR